MSMYIWWLLSSVVYALVCVFLPFSCFHCNRHWDTGMDMDTTKNTTWEDTHTYTNTDTWYFINKNEQSELHLAVIIIRLFVCVCVTNPRNICQRSSWKLAMHLNAMSSCHCNRLCFTGWNLDAFKHRVQYIFIYIVSKRPRKRPNINAHKIWCCWLPRRMTHSKEKPIATVRLHKCIYKCLSWARFSLIRNWVLKHDEGRTHAYDSFHRNPLNSTFWLYYNNEIENRCYHFSWLIFQIGFLRLKQNSFVMNDWEIYKQYVIVCLFVFVVVFFWNKFQDEFLERSITFDAVECANLATSI